MTTRLARLSYTQAAKDAIAVQDAVNLSGVVHSFVDAVTAIWDEAHATGQGTSYVNHHPIVTLFLDKLADLNGGSLTLPHNSYGEVMATVRAIASQDQSDDPHEG